jgi:hypothetical protein
VAALGVLTIATGVGINGERRVGQVLLQNVRVDRRDQQVVFAVHHQCLLLNGLEARIAIFVWDLTPSADGGGPGRQCGQRRGSVLVLASVSTLPERTSGGLARGGGLKEEIQEALLRGDFNRCLRATCRVAAISDTPEG